MTDNNTTTELHCDPDKPIVFYDGGCPLCNREISHYRKLDSKHAIRWVDITRDKASLVRHGLNYQQAMQGFHVLDTNNRWQTGAHGFTLMWSRLPGYRWLSRLLYRTGLVSLLEPIYRRFAVWRYRHRKEQT